MSLMDAMPTLKEVDHIQGPLSAALLMMTYGDYQCPQSGQAHQSIVRLQKTLGPQLCFIFRHFPQPHLYPQSQKAAETVEAAGSQGKFWEMHNQLFNNQQALDDASLVEYADQLDLNILQFLEEIGDRTHAPRIQIDVESALQYGVQETPTFFISVRHQGTDNLESFVKQILGVVVANSG